MNGSDSHAGRPARRGRARQLGPLDFVLAIVALVMGVSVVGAAVVLGLWWPLALPVGVLVGALTLILNGYLVDHVGAPREPGANRALAVAGLTMAVVLGSPVAAAGTVHAFGPRLDDEVRTQRLLAVDIQFGPRIGRLEADDVKLAALEDELSSVDVRVDPDVERLQGEYDRVSAEFDQAEKDLICENAGDCGTPPGRGPAYQDRLKRLDRLDGERRQARAALDGAIDAARAEQQEVNDERQDAVDADQERVRTELGELRDLQQDGREAAVDLPVGPFERLGALFPVSERVGWQVPALFGILLLLMVLLQVSPVWVRMHRGSDPPDQPDPRSNGHGGPGGNGYPSERRPGDLPAVAPGQP